MSNQPRPKPPAVAPPPVPAVRTATRIASGAVPPAHATGPSGPVDASVSRAATQFDVPRDRDSRVGTQMRGAEGLQAPGAEAPKLRLTAGKIVPGTRYKIVRWVGEGGMGVVYEAEHVDIARRVALKILRFDLSQQPRMVQVFKDEARAAGRLGSQYLVEIFDFGELKDGRLFFAMELLDGSDLVPLDPDTRMPCEQLVPILRQVCKGLAFAHKAGVVHRDVKPENIITTSAPDGRTQIKIVDFGISAMLAAGQANGVGLAGTPHYMAPEQIMGKPFDGRLDIYALGCTAYELLTGTPPFDAGAVEELLQKHVHEPALAPSRKVPDLKVPPAIEAVILRCLEKEPAERFRDTADLEAALCEAQIADGIETAWDDLPVPELDDHERQARITGSMPSLHPVVHKRGLLWPLVAGISSLAAAGLATFLLLVGPSDADKTLVDNLTSQAREAASRADWVVPSDPTTPTAYLKLVELEALLGSAENLADEQGQQLRVEFSASLVTQGDQLWDNNVKDLAKHLYFQSLLFDDSSAYAFERSGTTPSMLGSYIERAKRGEWTDIDRIVSSMAVAEATSNPEVKQKHLEALEVALDESTLDPAAAVILARVDTPTKLFAGRRRAKRRAEAAPPEAVATAVVPAIVPADTPAQDEPVIVVEDTPVAAEPAAPRAKKRRKSHDPRVLLGKAQRDPARAAELAKQGKAALAAGQRTEAASLFNQAIAYDRKNAKALMGLSDIYFDTGKNQKAVIYAEKAVRASPANGSYRLKLGDAYFKVLRYNDALEQYERAKKRGSSKAQARISKVKAKTG